MRIRRRQEGEGSKAPFTGEYAGFGAQSQGACRQCHGLGWDQDAAAAGRPRVPRLEHLWLDSAYRGEDKGKDWVQKALGWSVELVERPRKPAPKEVLKSWAKQWLKEGG